MSGLFGSSSPAGQTTTTQQASNPLTSYLEQGAAGANNAYQNFQPSPLTSLGYNLTGMRGLTGSPVTNAAKDSLTNMLSPGYLNPSTNPTFAASVNDALGQAKSNYVGLYGGPAGSNLNNSGFQEGLTRNLGNVATNAYTNQFNSLAGQQLAAAAQAPNAANQDYTNLSALTGAGQGLQNLPFAGVNQYGNSLSQFGGAGSTVSTSTPYFTNPAANALGLGVGAASLYNLGQNSGLWGSIGNLFSSSGSPASAGGDAGFFGGDAGGGGFGNMFGTG